MSFIHAPAVADDGDDADDAAADADDAWDESTKALVERGGRARPGAWELAALLGGVDVFPVALDPSGL
jgi:hypothetical protein